MHLVQDQTFIFEQTGIIAGFRQQDAVGHEFDHGIPFGAVVEPDLETDFPAAFAAGLGSETAGQRRGRDPPRLGAAYPSVTPESGFQRDFRQLGGFS